jgi:predicted metal-dependent phosphoesterase TrpH
MLIDLQLHSTYSDGYLTPTELARLLARQGVKAAALTDHNTISGLNEFRQAAKQYKIKPITGLELYVKLGNKKFNILWYNFKEPDQELHNILHNSQLRRRGKTRKILRKLVKRGFKISIDKTLDKYSQYIPINRIVGDIRQISRNRAKISRELKNKSPREDEIIKQYFFNPQIGKLHESYISFERVLKLRKRIGGQIIINHPAKYGYINIDFWKKLKKLGLDGAEVLSPHHSVGAVMYIQYLARELKLIETGGSDFHCFEGDRTLIKNSWQYFKINSRYLRGINKIIG